MGLFDKVAALLGNTTSATAGGILSSITKTADDIFNTAGDKEKAKEFESQASQAIQAQLDKHNEALQSLANQEFQEQISDIQNARATEVAILNAKAGSWLTKNIVAVLTIFVSFVWGAVSLYLFAAIIHLVKLKPDVNLTSVATLYASLLSAETIILSYHFGSSSGSKSKDDTIATIAKS